MKVAITSLESSLDSQIDATFGRCQYFIIVDTDSMEFEAIKNPSLSVSQGVGIQSAQLIAGKNISALITGHCGPNAFNVLNQSGIEVITGASGKVSQVIEDFKNGNLKSSESPDVGGHFGAGQGGGRGGGRGRGRM
jgi:predicted Fe-Mo cluster-binding NifX family protein